MAAGWWMIAVVLGVTPPGVAAEPRNAADVEVGLPRAHFNVERAVDRALEENDLQRNALDRSV